MSVKDWVQKAAFDIYEHCFGFDDCDVKDHMVLFEGIIIKHAPPEICLCAAILMPDGYIFRGHRHDDCYLTMGGDQRYTKADGHRGVQGFLTSHGRFVTRTEAAELHGRKGKLLFSEDL